MSRLPRRDPFERPEELIRRVYAYVAYRIGSGADAEDVTSEAFARALRYRESFDESRGDAGAWLIGIARRCVASHLADSRAAAPEPPPDVAALADVAERAAERVDLARAVSRLSDRDRELVALRYGADLTARQIGELLGSTPNAVEVALHRALGRLRETLEREDAGGRAATRPPIPSVRVDA